MGNSSRGKAWRGRSGLACLVLLLCCAVVPSEALELSAAYSPRNRERPIRPRTDYIVLHTTEGPDKGSFQKVWDNGEAHFFVSGAGQVYKVISKERIALHAGRSMWNGRANLDESSIGIEVSGYHDRGMTAAQYKAVRELVDRLKAMYGVPDVRVLAHSMVAYGAPNRWHPSPHRGRKRCGMLFARQSVRMKLGLGAGPTFDPDVKAGRLVAADPFLARVLYGGGDVVPVAAPSDRIAPGVTAWDVARERYNSPDTVYTYPDGKQVRGNEVVSWDQIPPGTRVSYKEADGPGGGGETADSADAGNDVKALGRDGKSAQDIAGGAYNSVSTVYVLPSGRVQRGDELDEAALRELPANTRILVGYRDGGRVTPKRRAFDICGPKWNYPSTFYLLPNGSIVSGDKMPEGAIPENAHIFFRL